MHARPDLRVFLKWKITRPDSVIIAVPLRPMLKFVTSTLVLTVLLGCAQNAPPSDFARFTVTLQDKSPEQIRDLIEKKYGLPDRNIGSGLVIEQWDISGGTLTFHPLAGPSFDDGKTVVRLMKTNNPVKDCLFGDYEMYTLPDTEIHGNQFWIGNVSMTKSKYEFTVSDSNLDRRSGQESNYFFNNPSGTVRVKYSKNINPETRLEDLDDCHLVAAIEFTSTDGTSNKEFDIIVDTVEMRLRFKSDKMPFAMNKGWANYWD